MFQQLKKKKKALNFDSVGEKCGMFDLSLK